MDSKKLVYNIINNTFKIIGDDIINHDIEYYVNILEDKFYVMRCKGEDVSMDEELSGLKITTCSKYYKILNDYILCFDNPNDEIEVETKITIYNLDDYIIEETFHFLDYDLWSFYLYKITKKNN